MRTFVRKCSKNFEYFPQRKTWFLSLKSSPFPKTICACPKTSIARYIVNTTCLCTCKQLLQLPFVLLLLTSFCFCFYFCVYCFCFVVSKTNRNCLPRKSMWFQLFYFVVNVFVLSFFTAVCAIISAQLEGVLHY